MRNFRFILYFMYHILRLLFFVVVNKDIRKALISISIGVKEVLFKKKVYVTTQQSFNAINIKDTLKGSLV